MVRFALAGARDILLLALKVLELYSFSREQDFLRLREIKRPTMTSSLSGTAPPPASFLGAFAASWR